MSVYKFSFVYYILNKLREFQMMFSETEISFP
jgi:hypothetical protein